MPDRPEIILLTKPECLLCDEVLTMLRELQSGHDFSVRKVNILNDETLLNKYRYHLPFYRQSKLFAHHGIHIPDNTLGGWAMQSADRLDPLREAFYQQLSQVNVLQADETPVKVLDPEKKAYVWLYHCYLPGKRFVLFEFNLSRSSHVVNERLKDFKGILQTDGYRGYDGLRLREDIINLGCWDHARRSTPRSA